MSNLRSKVFAKLIRYDTHAHAFWWIFSFHFAIFQGNNDKSKQVRDRIDVELAKKLFPTRQRSPSIWEFTGKNVSPTLNKLLTISILPSNFAVAKNLISANFASWDSVSLGIWTDTWESMAGTAACLLDIKTSTRAHSIWTITNTTRSSQRRNSSPKRHLRRWWAATITIRSAIAFTKTCRTLIPTRISIIRFTKTE